MSVVKELLVEIWVRDSLLAMRDNDEAAFYAVDRIDKLTERLNVDVSRHHYKWARMGLCDEDEIDQNVYIG